MTVQPLIRELTLVLGVAAVVTYLFRLVKQPVILGYLVAGFLIKPHLYQSSQNDLAGIQVWAEFGIIFLMFSMGLEFSFRKLIRSGSSVMITQAVQMIGMLAIGYGLGWVFGWTTHESIFLGCGLAISSTSIIVKTFGEFNLKGKRFVDIVYGILVLQDLAAIVMLVILSNFAEGKEFKGILILQTISELLFVVCLWFIIGMFFIPNLIKKVKVHGNDETLTLVSLSLCLMLVVIAGSFGYSAALGAFIMGAILGESQHSHYIAKLVSPLRDLFAAVFFVTVGMLIDTQNIAQSYFEITLVSFLVITGHLLLVMIGMSISGQSLKTGIQTGLCLGQIGEFSFIIAAVGAARGLVQPNFYGIIGGVSILTAFISPLLVKNSEVISQFVIKKCPASFLEAMTAYGLWLQKNSVNQEIKKYILKGIQKWILNAVIVGTIFTLSADYLTKELEKSAFVMNYAEMLAWSIASVLSSPSLIAMFYSFRSEDLPKKTRVFSGEFFQIVGQIGTVFFLGTLSMGFFPAYLTFVVTSIFCILYLFIFRSRIEMTYVKIESVFKSNFVEHDHHEKNVPHLVPWDAHLIEHEVLHRSSFVGKKLEELNIRNQYGLNVVMINRAGNYLVAPGPKETVFPGDVLLLFGTDDEIENFNSSFTEATSNHIPTNEEYELIRVYLSASSPLVGKSIRESDIRREYKSVIVGVERDQQRVRNPKAGFVFKSEDTIWVVGAQHRLRELLKNATGDA